MSAHYTTDRPGAEDSLIRTEALKFLHELPLTIVQPVVGLFSWQVLVCSILTVQIYQGNIQYCLTADDTE